jgi:hypothetical protein
MGDVDGDFPNENGDIYGEDGYGYEAPRSNQDPSRGNVSSERHSHHESRDSVDQPGDEDPYDEDDYGLDGAHFNAVRLSPSGTETTDPMTFVTEAIGAVSKALMAYMRDNPHDTPSASVIEAIGAAMAVIRCVYPQEVRDVIQKTEILENDLFGPGSPSTFLDEIRTAGNKRYGDVQAEDGTSPGGYIGTFYIACGVYARGTECEFAAPRTYAHEIPLRYMSTELMPMYMTELKTMMDRAPFLEKKCWADRYSKVRALLHSGVTQLGHNKPMSMPYRPEEHVGPEAVVIRQATDLQNKLQLVSLGIQYSQAFQDFVHKMLTGLMDTICWSFPEVVKDAFATDIRRIDLHGLSHLDDMKGALERFFRRKEHAFLERAADLLVDGKIYLRGTDNPHGARRMPSDDFRLRDMHPMDYDIHIAELKDLQTKVKGRRLVWVNELLLSVLVARDKDAQRGW